MTDMQENKKQLEEKVEALRTVKEAAEQPEKEAKERHLKAWEGECSCLYSESKQVYISVSHIHIYLQNHLHINYMKIDLRNFVCRLAHFISDLVFI